MTMMKKICESIIGSQATKNILDVDDSCECVKLDINVVNDLDFNLEQFSIDMKKSTKEVIRGHVLIWSKGLSIESDIVYVVSTDEFSMNKCQLYFSNGCKNFVFVDDKKNVIPYELHSFSVHQPHFYRKIFGSPDLEKKSGWMLDTIKIIKENL